jgi:glycosyltransferase involved in cell wall biosynthesis
MRVLVYSRTAALVDRGTPLRCRNLVTALASTDAEVLFVSGDASDDIRARLGVDHVSLPSGAAGRARLRAAAERFRPEVVYGQTHGALAGLVALDGVPGARRVVDLHGNVALEILEQTWRPLHRRLFSAARKWVRELLHTRRMDAFTAVTHNLARRVEHLGKPVHVLWGGVDLARFAADPRPRAGGGPIRVVYAGNFRAYQGVEVLLEAARPLVDAGAPFQFALIGGMDGFPEIERRARAILRHRGELLGQVSYAEIPALLAGADILVIPRISDRTAQYGFPSKLPEYMATGKPIIVTDVGEHARVIEHELTGLVIPPGSAPALTAALRRLEDPALRERLGGEARRFAESRLSWASLGAELRDFFGRVIDARGPHGARA